MTAGQRCICCGGDDVAPRFEGLLRCQGCGHVWADMELSDEALRALYSENYFKGEEYLDYEREEPALRKNFRQVLKPLVRLLPKGSRLWEVGTAYGYFLDEASAHFAVAGCDVSQQAVDGAVARFGLPIVCDDYLEKEAERPFDAVCFWDTVEHLREPDRYLAKAHADLRVGGLLALSTGDIGSWAARVRGAHWRLIHPPTHLHYFTTRSMRALLERLGFEVVSVRHRVFWRSADAVAYRVLCHERQGTGPAVYRALAGMGVLGFSFPMNTFDLMTVLAVKR